MLLGYKAVQHVTAQNTVIRYKMVSTVRSESRSALGPRYVDLVVSIEVTGEVCNCFIQFLVTMVLSIEVHRL
jgi:hypothetical protein